MTEPFAYLNSIMKDKTYLMENDDQAEKDYPAFFVNRGLSQHIDCLMYANEMNMNHHLDNRLVYDYLFHSIRKMKRPFTKWAKRSDNDIIKAISTYYNVGYKRAREFAFLLTKEQTQFIMKTMEETNNG